MKLSKLAGTFALAASLISTTTHAEEPAPSAVNSKQTQGKVRYERGVEAYAAGRFKDAIDLFLQADALAPSAALSFNIARAYEKIGDDAASLQWYRDFRRRAPDAQNGATVDERIKSLEASLAQKGVQQLTVISTPPGATVIIDDQPLGVTPFTGQLAPGTHRVVLSLKGYVETSKEVSLAADHAVDVSIELPAAPAAAAPVTAAAPSTTSSPAGSPPVDEGAQAGPRFGPWPWVGIGVGATALAGGLGFELARRKAEDDAKTDDTQVGYKEKLDSMESRQMTARVLSAIGGALVLTGGTLLVIDLTSRPRGKDNGNEPKGQVGAWCLPGSCAVSYGGTF
jgi:tetratricopeptide (TPR) repeat protein